MHWQVPAEPDYVRSAEARSRPSRPPRKPPKNGTSSGGDDEEGKHRRLVSELFARIRKGLKEAHLTRTQRRQYGQATRGVIARMAPAAVRRLHANTREFKYYPDHAALTAAVKEKYPTLARRLKRTSTMKGMFDKDGTVHLDGGGSLRGRAARLADFHAHELAHGIDGTSHALSDSKEWGAVWADEILGNDAFTSKAQEDYREAFSEVGSLLLGGSMSARELALLCPGVVGFWRDRHQLLAEE
jgi:hypothetical protein